jgi:hypothetical protein
MRKFPATLTTCMHGGSWRASHHRWGCKEAAVKEVCMTVGARSEIARCTDILACPRSLHRTGTDSERPPSSTIADIWSCISMDMTEKSLAAICKHHGLYRTPRLNDKLFANFQGFTKIANLEPYTGLKALFLEGNALTSLEGLPHLEELKCLCALCPCSCSSQTWVSCLVHAHTQHARTDNG